VVGGGIPTPQPATLSPTIRMEKYRIIALQGRTINVETFAIPKVKHKHTSSLSWLVRAVFGLELEPDAQPFQRAAFIEAELCQALVVVTERENFRAAGGGQVALDL
jgi:hypothetical protein